MNRVMISGASSGVGKTTISLGIMAALTKRGRCVAPFKVGPDYIDPAFHKFVTDNPSYNLDSWLLNENTLKYLFQRNMEDKDIGIIEGVMGLYDGFGIEKDEGSSAHVSKILKIPVLLIIDGRGMSSSAAAQVLGYKLYDEEVDIKGVIINKLSGKAHYELLKKVIEKDTNIPCLGFLPSNMNISLNSRHLGLVPAEEVENLKEKVHELVNMIEEYIDLDKIEEIAENVKTLNKVESPCEKLKGAYHGLRIGYARDEAFSFYYEDNLKLLREMGIDLIPFSPINDEDIPKDVDGLYIGGGFPEVFGKYLENNEKFRKNLKNYLENGLPTYAECGGLMYLTKGIKDLEGNYYEMVGFFETSSEMTKRLQRFGYVEIDVHGEMNIKGHEFHRSTIEDNEKLNYQYDVFKIREGKIKNRWKCGVINKNTLAAYAHIHFYSNPKFILKFIEKCKERHLDQTGTTI